MLPERLSIWARQTAAFLSDLCRTGELVRAPACPADHLIYRLRRWPSLPPSSQTADIYKALSMMSNRPVNRHWILNNSSLQAREVDWLLRRLVEQNAVEVLDAARYSRGDSPR